MTHLYYVRHAQPDTKKLPQVFSAGAFAIITYSLFSAAKRSRAARNIYRQGTKQPFL